MDFPKFRQAMDAICINPVHHLTEFIEFAILTL